MGSVGAAASIFNNHRDIPEKEDANMKLSTKQHIGRTLCIVGLGLTLTARTAEADVILSVPDPLDGVFAATRTTAAFGSSTNTPARATVTGAVASMRILGSELRFSANINGHCCDNFIASTGRGPQNIADYAPITVQILGTGGEASGTPVLINLTSGMSGGGVTLTHIFNNTNYPLGTSVIGGLGVGDTFSFWGMLNGTDGVSAVLTSSLTVSRAPGAPAPVPEPGTFALLTFGVVLGGLGLRRGGLRH